jgi:hypothetical protein
MAFVSAQLAERSRLWLSSPTGQVAGQIAGQIPTQIEGRIHCRVDLPVRSAAKDARQLKTSAGLGEIPDRRYSPRTPSDK